MQAKKGPNILFLMSDQHRWDALGIHNPIIKTPNLDKLAQDGILFENAFCNAPLCVPSRYSMMTGLYPSQCGIRNNSQQCLSDESLPWAVLPQRLKALGYKTGGFGKTHWYNQFSSQSGQISSTRGFDVRAQHFGYARNVAEPGAINVEDELGDDFKQLDKEYMVWGVGGESADGYVGGVSKVPEERQLAAWLTDKALDFLGNIEGEEDPFFLYLSFSFPHAPALIPPGYEDFYDIENTEIEIPEFPMNAVLDEHSKPWEGLESWKSKTPKERKIAVLRYYTICHLVDKQFGRIISKLKEMNQYENTMILFVSDHGDMLGERNRFSKYCMYESSIRIPMIISGKAVPSRMKGTRSQQLVSLIDIMPTLVSAAGGDVPIEAPGRNILGPFKERGVFCEMTDFLKGRIPDGPVYMWRTEEWKLILYMPGPLEGCQDRISETKGELYHLSNDHRELKNMYEQPEYLPVREKFTRDLLMHLACSWARFPSPSTKD